MVPRLGMQRTQVLGEAGKVAEGSTFVFSLDNPLNFKLVSIRASWPKCIVCIYISPMDIHIYTFLYCLCFYM